MANRFWVGGGSSTSWAATANTNWATTSGGANNASVPTTTDVAVFDSNSGSAASVIGAAIAIQGLECDGNAIGTGTYAGTITHNAFTLTINTGAASSFRLTSGMTYTPSGTTSLVTFTNTSGTAQLKSAGKALAAVTVNGVGGTVQQQDDLSINAVQNSILTIANGVYDMNSHALTACVVACSNTNTRSFLMGSTLTVGGNIVTGATPLTFATTTGLTFTKNSCVVVVLSPTTNIATQNLSWGGLTYNAVTINSTTTQVVTSFSDSSTFSSLSIGSGNFLFLTLNNTYTITSAFTWAGTSSAPIMVSSSSTGGKATISCPSGSCTFNWVFLYNIVTSGGATFTATNALQGGAFNNGFAISPPADGTSAGIPGTLWTDLLAGSDFSTGSSVGALLKSLTNLQYTVQAIGRGTVTSGATLTSIPTSAYTTAPSASIGNQLSGHAVLFDAATTTTALRGQLSLISASTASSTPTLTVAALTATPAAGDTFSVI